MTYIPNAEREPANDSVFRWKMLAAAADLDFEKAARFRDQLLALKGEKPMATNEKSKRARRRRERTRK